MRATQYLLIPVLLLCISSASANSNAALHGDEANLYESNTFALGVGFGIVEFDTNVKVKKDGRLPYYIDLEGNLDLPERSPITTVYGGYHFNDRHSLYFAAFGINRKTTLLDFDENFEDILILSADITLTDKTRFYNVNYGYTIFQDNRSYVTLVAGINGMDLNLIAEARGQITVLGFTKSEVLLTGVNIFAPLPLIGMRFGFSFTPKWSFETVISIVAGSYKDVTARLRQTSINTRYKLTNHIGLILGLTYFDADVEVKNGDVTTDVFYGYNGGFIGMHFLY